MTKLLLLLINFETVSMYLQTVVMPTNLLVATTLMQQWRNNNWLSCPRVRSNMIIHCIHKDFSLQGYSHNCIIVTAQYLFIVDACIYYLFSFGPVLTGIKYIMQQLTLQMEWNPKTNC